MEASKVIMVALIIVVGAAAISHVKAKGDEEGTICGVTQSELMECKPAVAIGPAKPPKPTEACCGSLKHANLTCFCTFKNNMYLPLLRINVTRAMQLPSTCDPTQTLSCT